MIELSPQQRRALRAKAHHLHPVVSVGQHGLTPRVLHEIDVALNAHELVKVRVHSDDRAEREAMLARIAEELQSAPVQHLGKLLIVWRPLQEAASEGPSKKAKRAAKKPAKRPGRSPATKPPGMHRRDEREPRGFQPTARRARGAGPSAATGNPPGDDFSPLAGRRRLVSGASAGRAARDAGEPSGSRPPRPGGQAKHLSRGDARRMRGTGPAAPRAPAAGPAVNPRRRRRAG